MIPLVVRADCRELAPHLVREGLLVDAVVTDPPYGIGFMDVKWDYDVPGPEYWRAILTTARPGAHLLAFGASKKDHRLACAIEDAGWEIRDKIAWFYGQGYPKSPSSLKPAYEPIVLARALRAPACSASTRVGSRRSARAGTRSRATGPRSAASATT